MKRKRSRNQVKDNDLKSPNPKDSRTSQAKPALANSCVRRNLARSRFGFDNPFHVNVGAQSITS